jgi:ATP-binding cassette, subfamily C, bacteriocin exporter
MNKLHHIRKNFVRQISENDCGAACLSMVLNYIGKGPEIASLRGQINVLNELSLLEIRKLAEQFDISCQCVEMQIEFLRNISTPCIIHTQNESGQGHYQVCYGAMKKYGKYKFLMADPAKQVYLLPENELRNIWVSKAAVYFNYLEEVFNTKSPNPWFSLLSINYFPKGLFISIPFINLCSVSLGIAISWVLQKGINDSLADKKNSLLIGIIFLLLIITISRSLFSFIKQRILIILNNSVNEQLVRRLILKLVGSNFIGKNAGLIAIKHNLSEIQKIQNALSVFVATLLSDGSLILLLVSASCYTLALSGLINIIYLIVVSTLTIMSLPKFSFDYAHLNQLSGLT